MRNHRFTLFCIFLSFLSTAPAAYSQKRNESGSGVNRMDFGETTRNTKTDDRDARVASGVSQDQRKTNTTEVVGMGTSSGKKVSSGFVLYRKVTKKNGWYVGVGKAITPELASHLPCYYKLANKNAAGNWTTLQAFNGYGVLTTNHSLATYLVNPSSSSDSGANTDFLDQLKTVCQWKCVGNDEGTEVIREVAFDEDDNVIYSFYPVKVGERQYMGHYSDSWGMPLALRGDSDSDITYVKVTRDGRGFDHVVEFVDQKGYTILNSNGAYGTRYTCDDLGNVLRDESITISGARMLDEWGNCGWEAQYDKDGNEVVSYYYNDRWERIRVPVSKRSSLDIGGTMYTYDQYGRKTSEAYIDEEGRPIESSRGVHKVVFEYNERGKRTRIAGYDLNGRLHAFNASGVAYQNTVWNTKGSFTTNASFDASGNYVNWDGTCLSECVFADDDETALTIRRYKAVGGKKHLYYEYVFNPEENTTTRWWPDDDYKSVTKLDDQDRETGFTIFDSSGNPRDGNSGFHKRVITYSDYPDQRIKDTRYYDKNGRPVVPEDLDYCWEHDVTDSLGKRVFRYKYPSLDDLPESYVSRYDDDFQTLIGQTCLTRYGSMGRTGYDHLIYYDQEVVRNLYGKINSYMAKNEFGEPAYFVDSEWERIYHLSVVGKDGGRQYYDVAGQKIEDMEAFMRSTPQAFCVEVTDTTKNRGFRDGDIVVSWGDWSVSEDLISNMDDFYRELVLKCENKNQIRVIRYDEEGNGEIMGGELKGYPDDLGIYVHRIWYTPDEAKRLRNVLRKEHFLFGEPVTEGRKVLIAIPTKSDPNSGAFSDGYTEPGVLLCAQRINTSILDGLEATIELGDGLDEWNAKRMFNPSKWTIIYYTSYPGNASGRSRYVFSGRYAFNFVEVKIPESTYKHLVMRSERLKESEGNLMFPVLDLGSSGIHDFARTMDIISEDVTDEVYLKWDKKSQVYSTVEYDRERAVSKAEFEYLVKDFVSLSPKESIESLFVLEDVTIREIVSIRQALDDLDMSGYVDLGQYWDGFNPDYSVMTGKAVVKRGNTYVEEFFFIGETSIVALKGHLSPETIQTFMDRLKN